MEQFILFVHILVCVGLIAMVLLQQGKGADAGAAFGSGASSTVFGSKGSNDFMYSTTKTFVFMFFVTSLTLGYFIKQRVSPIKIEEIEKVSEELQLPTK